jgi:hypothetical protein
VQIPSSSGQRGPVIARLRAGGGRERSRVITLLFNIWSPHEDYR